MQFRPQGVAVAALLGVSAAMAQPSACERPAGAPEWLPCGPDRVLGAAELKEFLVKDATTTRMQIKGGDSGKMFFLNLLPDGKMEAGAAGGPNIGRSWALQGDKVCRTYWRVYNGPQCATFELRSGVLYLVDPDNSRNPVTAVEFAK